MRFRVKRWPEVRGLLAALLAQILASLSSALAVSAALTLPGLGLWETKLALLVLVSSLTLIVGVEGGKCPHTDLALTAAALASTSQALYTMVILA
ncbi:MAG: hypothetical protein QXO86_03365 [Nitrososphaerota archaeon]